MDTNLQNTTSTTTRLDSDNSMFKFWELNVQSSTPATPAFTVPLATLLDDFLRSINSNINQSPELSQQLSFVSMPSFRASFKTIYIYIYIYIYIWALLYLCRFSFPLSLSCPEFSLLLSPPHSFCLFSLSLPLSLSLSLLPTFLVRSFSPSLFFTLLLALFQYMQKGNWKLMCVWNTRSQSVKAGARMVNWESQSENPPESGRRTYLLYFTYSYYILSLV